MDSLLNIFGYGMRKPDERDQVNSGLNWFDQSKNYLLGDKDVVGGKTMDTRSGGLVEKAKNIDYSLPGSDFDRKFAIDQSNKLSPNKIQNQNIIPFDPSQGGVNQNLAGDQSINQDTNFMSKLANMAGVDMKEATANWKDKGGFEGLMSNPGFTLGLALMQSSAQGKSIGAGVLDNFVKAAGISAQFKDRMDARKMEPIQATSGDIAEVKDILKSINIEEGNWFEIY